MAALAVEDLLQRLVLPVVVGPDSGQSVGVVVFREKPVVHDQGPRLSKATLFDAEGRTRISAGKVFPTEDELEWTESESPPVLMAEIESYVEEVCSYLRANRDVSPPAI